MLDQKVLQPAQLVMDDVALEIRVDKLPVKQGDEYTWIGHDLYLNETNHRGTYWAPFWGAVNNGELLTAEQALQNFAYFLNVVTNNGENTNHVIEQFNFYDNTPYFPNNANIKPDEIDDFLLGAAPMLEKYSHGFGVWAYRDYVDNGIHNGSFELGTDGWSIDGDTEIKSEAGDEMLTMSAGSEISQSFQAGKRFMLISQYQDLQFCVDAKDVGELAILVEGEVVQNWNLQAGENCTSLDAEAFRKTTPTTFGVKAITAIQIDELNLYGFTQILGLYDAQGKPAQNLAAYRKLNELVD